MLLENLIVAINFDSHIRNNTVNLAKETVSKFNHGVRQYVRFGDSEVRQARFLRLSEKI
jgi:hypothetical protein